MNNKIFILCILALLVTPIAITASSSASLYPFAAKYITPFGSRYTYFITPSQSVVIECEKGVSPKGFYQEDEHIIHYSEQKTITELKQIKALFKKQHKLNQKAPFSKAN